MQRYGHRQGFFRRAFYRRLGDVLVIAAIGPEVERAAA